MPNGLKFRKLDLHVHTPGSHDFVDADGVTAYDVVSAALEKGLDGIAVTDHNTGSWIDRVKEASHGTGLTVFPGVEISCGGGGTTGIHILALFDPSKGTQHVAALLSQLGILPDEWGNPESFSDKTPTKTFETIRAAGGLAVAAHAGSSKGLLQSLRGQPRIKAVRHPDLLAAEGTDFFDERKTRERTRVFDYLDGSDANYRRKLAVYQASDNPNPNGTGGHSLAGIGSRASFFKVERLDIEGLRQCFVHPEARIRMAHHDVPCRRVLSLEVDGDGFLGGKTIEFNRGLNSIIGGKGVGKSLIVELIRYALDDPPSDPGLRSDHDGKLAACLAEGDTVELKYQLASGTTFSVRKTYAREGQEAAVACANTETGEVYTGHIRKLLPALIYSQTEIIKIAENKDAQRQLIDRFIDAASYERRANECREQLATNDTEYAVALEATDDLEQTRLELGTAEEELRQVQKILAHETLVQKETADRKSSALAEEHDELGRRSQSVAELIEAIDARSRAEPNQEFSTDDRYSAIRGLAKASDEHLKATLLVWLQEQERTTEEANGLLSEWRSQKLEIDAHYRAWIDAEGGDRATQERLRSELADRIGELTTKVADLQEKADTLAEVRRDREGLLRTLDSIYDELYSVRCTKYEELTGAAGERLRLSIARGQSIERYEEQLVDLLAGGSTIPVPMRRHLARAVPPRRLAELVLEQDADTIALEATLSKGNAQKVVAHLKSRMLGDVLELEHGYLPEDVPTIEYEKSAGIYAPLERLSIGQKCSALMLVALTDGELPVIVDQPEDALDVVSIWEDVSQRLIASKDSRQFIVTTHNSSVAVASDSDQFIVVSSDATKATIECSGAIDSENVRAAIVDHLEGGGIPYALRRLKYGSDLS